MKYYKKVVYRRKSDGALICWCELCQRPMVLCSDCGNNSCNGGSRCEQCETAYCADQELTFKDYPFDLKIKSIVSFFKWFWIMKFRSFQFNLDKRKMENGTKGN